MQSSRLRNRLLAQTGQFRAATAYCGVRIPSIPFVEYEALSFVDVVHAAIIRNLSDIAQEVSHAEIEGYAICTDDDLITIFGVATTRDFASSVDSSLRYGAVEWPYGYKSNAFDEARLELARRYEVVGSESFPRHVEESFEMIVEALSRVRASGILAKDCLLYACSTDPGPHLEIMEMKSLWRLNSPEGVGKWEETHGPAKTEF